MPPTDQKPPNNPDDPAEETLRLMIRKFQDEGRRSSVGRIEKEIFGLDFED